MVGAKLYNNIIWWMETNLVTNLNIFKNVRMGKNVGKNMFLYLVNNYKNNLLYSLVKIFHGHNKGHLYI